jgi:SAM-dependent methyltransferase
MATDHFGRVANHYASHRPIYPAALFVWLASQCADHTLAWDCGAGSGQASIALTTHFEHVLATDMSEEQLAQATPHPRIEYRAALAESSGLPDHSADVVTVAQALHWFDRDRFYAEVRRVLKPGGIVAAWSYGVIAVDGDEVNAVIQDFYHRVIGPYWPAERHHVETGYRELPFPFQRIEPPPLEMQADWTLAHLAGYLRSWSASARHAADTGRDAVTELVAQLAPCWGDSSFRRTVRWPLAMLVGR